MILDMDRVYIPKTVSELADYLSASMSGNAPEYWDVHRIHKSPERAFAVARYAIQNVKGINKEIREYLIARTDENWERLHAGEIRELSLSFQELGHLMRSRRYRQPRELIIDRNNATPLNI